MLPLKKISEKLLKSLKYSLLFILSNFPLRPIKEIASWARLELIYLLFKISTLYKGTDLDTRFCIKQIQIDNIFSFFSWFYPCISDKCFPLSKGRSFVYRRTCTISRYWIFYISLHSKIEISLTATGLR